MMARNNILVCCFHEFTVRQEKKYKNKSYVVIFPQKYCEGEVQSKVHTLANNLQKQWRQYHHNIEFQKTNKQK